MTGDGSEAADTTQPPARLRALISWQAGKINTVGARLTASRMPLAARGDFAVLAALEEYGPLSQAELGRRLGLDRNDINGVVDRLQDEGRAERRVDPADRRRNLVSLTSGGRDYLDELQAHTDAVQAELVSTLTTAEATQLRDLMAKVLRAHPGLPS
jgi:DNA-binding MarR family transcriptional regulator